ncbi:UDP-glucosyltransferase 2-like isoform X1 [Zerene cesonia]|uniref:UDP-glucosyltransferase 2-like isoform X1 n=1 Tax=Zerene cesonia TaxID=33412 RepID=UPI0018E53F96|nr:UDP-glucosyltransferase 2-like isoform X1 [Zerene cesonia]
MRPTFTVYAVIAFLSYVHGARILGLFPHTGKSHHMVFEPLLKKLAERGHQMTVASFFPLKNPPANYTEISFEGIAGIGVETIDLSWFENLNLIYKIPIAGEIYKQISDFTPLSGMALNVCGKAIDWPPLVDALKKEYDIVIVENFNSDCMLGLLHVYGIKVPVISLSSSNVLPWATERIGVVDNPSYLPVVSAAWTAPLTYMERIKNTFLNVYFKLWYFYDIQEKERAVIEKFYGRKVPLYELSKNITLMMINTFYPINGVRPLLPGFVEVGGMHLDNGRKPIPEYIERFLNESEHGVVLFSFGSLIKTSTIPKHKEEIIVKALSKLKQRVIWKYEDSEEEGTLSGNILKVRWLPQYELLRHKKVVAFIAHGGLLGMTEAVSAGKPMVVVPFFGDQPSNAASAEFAGFAKVLQYSELTEESLSAALESVLSAEMRLQARTVSKIWNDRQNPPLDTAVYWVERVLRWGPAAKLHSPARDLAFYEYALLDVAAAFIAIILVTLALLWYTLSKLSRMFLKESKQKLH